MQSIVSTGRMVYDAIRSGAPQMASSLIPMDDLKHHGVYYGYSPREIYVGTWDAEKRQFFIRVVEKGDSKFRPADYPSLSYPESNLNCFIPVELAK